MKCRICASEAQHVFSLGSFPQSGNFPPTRDEAKNAERYPLDLYLCPMCHLSQLGETITPRTMFIANQYLASTSAVMKKHQEHLAEDILKRSTDDTFVIDIGCNDGMLLSILQQNNRRVLGIDPSLPAGSIARKKGIPVLREFFSPSLLETMKLTQKAAIICCTNTLQHVDDLHAFMEGMKLALNEDGRCVIDVGHVLPILKDCSQIHHEYITYFWSKPLMILAGMHGFSILSVEMLPLHGGVLRVWMQQSTKPHAAMLPEEQGLDHVKVYAAAGAAFKNNIVAIRAFLQERRNRGERMVVYGASARGVVLANLCGLQDFVEACVDTTPTKIGKFIPGLGITIIDERTWRESGINTAILLATSLEAEILKRTTAYQNAGGTFIRLIPHPAVIV